MEEEGLVWSEIIEEGGIINIISVYNREGWNRKEEILDSWIEKLDREHVFIGGDFNIRIGELGGGEEEEGVWERKSKDRVIGNGGRNLVEWILNKGWYLLNGSTKGDWEGEYTFTGARGSSVIDYMIACEEIHDRMREFRVDARVDSDHMPLVALLDERDWELGENQEDHEEGRKEVRNEESRWKICWDKKAIENYKKKTEGDIWEDTYQVLSIEEKWNKLKEIIHEAMIRKEIKIKNRKIGFKDWWDRNCTRKKREVKRMYMSWRKGKVGRRRYMEERNSMKALFEQKRKEKRIKEEEDLKNLRHGTDIWKYINRKRKKKVWKENKIGGVEWMKYFKELLGSTEEMAEDKEEENIIGTVEERPVTGSSLGMEEIAEAVGRLKKNKAVSIDGISLEAWLYGGSTVRKGLVEVLNKVWKEGILPKDWRTSIIVPLHKRGDENKVGNYRGISLLCSAYKIYAEIIRGRLEESVERKGLLPESKAGFRRGRSTMDNIFVLDHLTQRVDKNGKKGKVYALFADLKAAFDNVERGQLWRILRKMGIEEKLIGKLESVYAITKVAIKSKEGLTKEFYITKGVRQGCVLSPMLFNLYIAEIRKVLEERNIGGIQLRDVRVWSLEYADDIVFLAKNREAMLDIMDTVRKFFRERKMILCTDKTKMVVFNRKGREKVEKWKWGIKGKEIEEVKTFKYLGFVFNRSGKLAEHIKELCRKGRIAANRTWGLGERICRNDFIRRGILFRYLVRSVMSYGVEIWGWEEKKNLEKIMMDYARWVFKLKFCTPRYLISRELGMSKLRIGWGIRALKFEDKVREADDVRWIKKCWLEKESNDWNDRYGKEREKYFNRNGWSVVAVEALRREGRNLVKEMRNRDTDVQRQLEESKILESRYNKKYRELNKDLEGPSYLRMDNIDKEDLGDSIRALLNLRCGNLELSNRYWLEEEKCMCIFCNEGKDSMKHYVEECTMTKEWFCYVRTIVRTSGWVNQ
ncbi:uncharacterized protein LOC143905535 [Temnothorax americanus]|uniref:uncharacterized protein LOC143905535 n=1 Tax=Temnothorax americanus TaxID=1964332 RepID=UPI004068FBE1